jgi:ParB/RepB/Spo0J family partition protein
MALAMKPAPVTHVDVADIGPNPHNPRRLFDEEPMQILSESIQKLGILVPITVYEPKQTEATVEKRYFILDGERRWRCAQELGIKQIPAIVIEEPDDITNVLTMFHIHNVREGWQLMPIALKLQTLMKTLKEDNERKLAELTKLTITQVRRCKILLTYPKRFQNMMLAPVSERLKTDLFIELQRIRGPALKERFPPWIKRGDDKCIEIVLDKFGRDVIKAVTEFRRLAEVYRASLKANRAKTFFKQLDRFLADPDRTIDEVIVPGATFAAEAKEIRRSAKRLFVQLEAIELEAIASDTETINLLKRLAKILRDKLDEALLVEVRDTTETNN